MTEPNHDRSFHELRLAIERGERDTFTADEVRSLLRCIDGLDAELAAATHEEQRAKFELRKAKAEAAEDHRLANTEYDRGYSDGLSRRHE